MALTPDGMFYVSNEDLAPERELIGQGLRGMFGVKNKEEAVTDILRNADLQTSGGRQAALTQIRQVDPEQYNFWRNENIKYEKELADLERTKVGTAQEQLKLEQAPEEFELKKKKSGLDIKTKEQELAEAGLNTQIKELELLNKPTEIEYKNKKLDLDILNKNIQTQTLEIQKTNAEAIRLDKANLRLAAKNKPKLEFQFDTSSGKGDTQAATVQDWVRGTFRPQIEALNNPELNSIIDNLTMPSQVLALLPKLGVKQGDKGKYNTSLNAYVKNRKNLFVESNKLRDDINVDMTAQFKTRPIDGTTAADKAAIVTSSPVTVSPTIPPEFIVGAEDGFEQLNTKINNVKAKYNGQIASFYSVGNTAAARKLEEDRDAILAPLEARRNQLRPDKAQTEDFIL
jgi:hypothetical protein